MTNYDDIQAMNQSTLKYGLASMKHLRAKLDGEREKSTPALVQGQALHTRLFEPHLFCDRYHPEPFGRRGTNKWKACMAAHAAECPRGTTFISWATWEKARLMANSAYNHQAVGLLRAHGGVETTLEADLCGVPCKGRLDKLIMAPATVVDVKTCRSTDPHDVDNAIWEYRYDIQAAFYCDLAEAVHGKPFVFMMIMIESAPPWDVCVKRLDEDSLAVGRQEYRGLLHKYKNCMATGVWPGRSDEIEFAGLPAWKLRQYERCAL